MLSVFEPHWQVSREGLGGRLGGAFEGEQSVHNALHPLVCSACLNHTGRSDRRV